MARYRMVGTGPGARPAPRRLARKLIVLEEDTGAGYASLCRTQEAVDFARERGAVLSSQPELYDGFVAGLPGFNPANPPGQSTHELRSDGVVYPGPVGRPLFGYQCGIDSEDPDAHIVAAKKRGWIMVRPYDSASEAQHINFVRSPLIDRKPLKRGSKGRRVRKLKKRLKYLGYFKGPVDGRFGPKLEEAVRAFQKRKGMKVDGVVGKHTWAQLTVSFRRKWRAEK